MSQESTAPRNAEKLLMGLKRRVKFPLIAHISFKSHNRETGIDKSQPVLGYTQREAFAAAVVVEHYPVHFPLFGNSDHHIAF